MPCATLPAVQSPCSRTRVPRPAPPDKARSRRWRLGARSAPRRSLPSGTPLRIRAVHDGAICGNSPLRTPMPAKPPRRDRLPGDGISGGRVGDGDGESDAARTTRRQRVAMRDAGQVRPRAGAVGLRGTSATRGTCSTIRTRCWNRDFHLGARAWSTPYGQLTPSQLCAFAHAS